MAEAVETLTEFALTHEEIVQRRRLLYGGESGGDETSGTPSCTIFGDVTFRFGLNGSRFELGSGVVQFHVGEVRLGFGFM